MSAGFRWPGPSAPSPDLVPLPHEDAGGPCHGSQGGREGWVPNTAKGPEVRGALGHLEGGTPARRPPQQDAASPLPRPVASPPASPPRPLRHATSAAAAAAASSPGALIPAPARHFRMCPPARAQSRAPPPRRPRASAGGGAATSPRTPSAPALTGPEPLWSRDDAASALLCSLNVAHRRQVTVGWRLSSSSCAASVSRLRASEPVQLLWLQGRGTPGPRGSHAGSLPWNLKEADWRMLNPMLNTPGGSLLPLLDPNEMG